MQEKKITSLINGYGNHAWRILVLLLIGVIGFIGTRIYDSVQAMPKELKDYVTIERYTYDQETLLLSGVFDPVGNVTQEPDT